MTIRQFPLRAESEFLVWCARTDVPDELKERIRQRAQGPFNWVVVLALAWRHGVSPLLYRNLSTICSDLVPSDTMTQLRQKVQAGALLNRALAEELVLLCEAFAAQGVPVMPIKGATLAASAYGDVTLRDFSDLDLLIPERSAAEAQTVLLARGYERKGPSSQSGSTDHEEGPYHVFIKKRTLFRVDLQWVMAHDHFAFRLDRPEFWQRQMAVSFGGKTVQGLMPEDLLIVLCVHGSKHAWEQLKWVCDVAELLRAYDRLDWDQIFSSASMWRCRRLLIMGVSLAHRLFDMPLPSAVLAHISVDSDVQMLSHRMPVSLLADPSVGVTEAQAVALYFTLKDSWRERWRFGLALCRDQSPILMSLPAWFRWRSSLLCLASLVRPLQRTMRSLSPTSIRNAINRWVEHGG